MRKVISFLLEELDLVTDEVSFHFVTEGAIRELHKRFFNDATPTDCITLPLDSPSAKRMGYHVMGEAFICPKTALFYAKKEQIEPETEVYRYIIHCLLHFMGYTDAAPKKKAQMKRKEGACLKKLLFALKQNPF